MQAQATFDIGTVLISVAGFLFVLLVGIIGFGIKGTLSRIEDAIKDMMTVQRCQEHHDAHQKQHDLEALSNKDQHEDMKKNINGIGSKLQKYIDVGFAK
jgi:hypothetical protein